MGGSKEIRNNGYFILILVVSAWMPISKTASTDEFKSVVTSLAVACQSEIGASGGDVEDVVHRNIMEAQSGKCVLRCVYQKLGGMQGDKLGTDQQVLTAYTTLYDGHEEKMQNAPQRLHVCRQQVEEMYDGCELAHNLLLCLKQFD